MEWVRVEEVTLKAKEAVVEVTVGASPDTQWVCPTCGTSSAGYDHVYRPIELGCALKVAGAFGVQLSGVDSCRECVGCSGITRSHLARPTRNECGDARTKAILKVSGVVSHEKVVEAR
jgi:hypothetical protein